MTVEIIYETHSITTDNENGIATGWLPGELSERGRQLAFELGRRRRDDDLAAVFVSDLRRAVETAEIAFAGSDISIIQDARLRECNYGDLNGMPIARLAVERSRHIDDPSQAVKATGRSSSKRAISCAISPPIGTASAFSSSPTPQTAGRSTIC